MPDTSTHSLLEALLDSWDRNNTITVNLLRAVSDDALHVRPMPSSPSVAQLFMHLIYIRFVHIVEDAPEFAREVPEQEWGVERDRDRLVQLLNDSATAVRDAVRDRVTNGRAMQQHYDHPILMIQHLLWHDAYHHGQIKLALKMAGRPLSDDEVGVQTWGVWMDKTS